MSSPSDIVGNTGFIDNRSYQDSNNVYITDNSVDNRVDNSTTYYIGTDSFTSSNGQEETAGLKWARALDWLSTINFGNKHIDILRKREPGTGQWFLKHPLFLNWLDGVNHILFCHGIPGAGKSMLMSIAINYLEELFKDDNQVGIVYLYCNYSERSQHTAENLISSILRQLAVAAGKSSRRTTTYDAVLKLHEKHKRTLTKPLPMEYKQALISMISQFQTIFILIDGLDEMIEQERDRFLAQTKGLLEEGVRMLVMARPIVHLMTYFEDSPRFEVLATKDDLVTYITGQITTRQRLAALVRLNPSFTTDIIDGIIARAQGMFLLARFHLDKVETANSEREARAILQDLPDEIDGIYAEVLERIKAQSTRTLELARAVLTWVTYAMRPLKPKELQHALAIKEDSVPDLQEDSLILEERMLSACSGLVISDMQSGTMRLVHYTAQDYIRHKGSDIVCPEPHARIASACITYLSLDGIADDGNYTFMDYAAGNWGNHAHEVSPLPQDLNGRIMKHLENYNRADKPLVRMTYAEWAYGLRCLPTGRDKLGPQRVAARFGLVEVVKQLLKSGGMLRWLLGKSAEVSPGRLSPLATAIRWGHENVVQLLLDNGAWLQHLDLDSQYNLARGNNEGIVRLLLEHDTSLTTLAWIDIIPTLFSDKRKRELFSHIGPQGLAKFALDSDFGGDVRGLRLTADHFEKILMLLAIEGYPGVARLLSERTAGDGVRTAMKLLQTAIADDNFSGLVLEKCVPLLDWHGHQSLLSVAAEFGREGIVRMLLEKGFDANEPSLYLGKPPVYIAAWNGHESIVQLLLEKGADDKLARVIPLLRAANEGNEVRVRELLDQGLDVNMGWQDEIPIILAAAGGHEGVVKLLLQRGATLGVAGTISLLAAAKSGHTNVVRLLLTEGVDVNSGINKLQGLISTMLGHAHAESPDELHGTDDSEASQLGAQIYESITNEPCRLSLKVGVDVHFRTKLLVPLPQHEQTPLLEAVRHCQEDVIRILLENGADVDQGSPLTAALHANDEVVIRLLLENGVDLDAPLRVIEVQPPVACRGGHVTTHKYEKTAIIQAHAEKIGTIAINHAARMGYIEVVRLLLDRGVSVDAEPASQFCTPLTSAAAFGHEDVVQLLLRRGADLGRAGSDALSLATGAGYTGVIRTLLEGGCRRVAPAHNTYSCTLQ